MIGNRTWKNPAANERLEILRSSWSVAVLGVSANPAVSRVVSPGAGILTALSSSG